MSKDLTLESSSAASNYRFSDVFTAYRVVCEEDIDELQHVNNLQYLRWTLKAAVAHSSQVGWPPERYRELGAGWVVRSHKITYKVPALPGDEVAIRTWIADVEKISSLRKYEITRASDGRFFALAETQWVFVDYRTLKPVAVPAEVKTAFAKSS
jgi:acyl-CoA thioester hydrolase